MVDRAVKVRILMGALVVLIAALSLGAGCGQQSSGQDQALEEQRQKNEELEERLAAQEKEQEEAEKREQAAKQEDMQEQMDAIEKKLAEESESEPQESEPQESETQENEPESEPDVVIQAASPSQAPEGVVVVPSGYDVPAADTEESAVLSAAIAYYQEVEVGDYYATHSLLTIYDQDYYPVDVWVDINTALDNTSYEFVVTDVYPEDIGTGNPTYAVQLTIYSPDGSTTYRKTYFTDEGNGYWAHWLTEEEMDGFNSAL